MYVRIMKYILWNISYGIYLELTSLNKHNAEGQKRPSFSCAQLSKR